MIWGPTECSVAGRGRKGGREYGQILSSYSNITDDAMTPTTVSERFDKAGLLILGRNQFALLQGLLDRPESIATSRDDWIRAALPLARSRPGSWPSYSTMSKSIRRLPSSLVRRWRVGRRIHTAPTQRGRDVLFGLIQVHIIGIRRADPS